MFQIAVPRLYPPTRTTMPARTLPRPVAAASMSPKSQPARPIHSEIDAWARHAGALNGFADTATGC